MKLRLDEMQQDIRDAARDFAQGRIAPNAAAWDEAGVLPAEFLQELGELGFLGLLVSEERGGAGLDRTCFALVIHEVAKASGAAAVALAAHNAVAHALAQSEAFYGLASELCGGLRSGVWSEHREGALSVFSGSATDWVSVASLASESEEPVCVQGPALGDSGFAGPSLGLRALRRHEVEPSIFRRDPVALKLVTEARFIMRLGLAAAMLGRGEAALGAAISYAKEREQFGKPIASFQAIQWMIADSRAGLDGAWMLTLRAAFMGSGAEMASVHAGRAARETCDAALQIHGGYGYTTEYPVERCLRDSVSMSTMLGGRPHQRRAVATSVLR